MARSEASVTEAALPERAPRGSGSPEPPSSQAPTVSRTGRRRWPWIAALLLALLLAESLLPANRQPTARALVAAIHLYQGWLSPRLTASGVRCRFEPSCSHYAEAVIRRFGTVRGVGLAGWRLLRCGPWTPAGTLDPPP